MIKKAELHDVILTCVYGMRKQAATRYRPTVLNSGIKPTVLGSREPTVLGGRNPMRKRAAADSMGQEYGIKKRGV